MDGFLSHVIKGLFFQRPELGVCMFLDCLETKNRQIRRLQFPSVYFQLSSSVLCERAVLAIACTVVYFSIIYCFLGV